MQEFLCSCGKNADCKSTDNIKRKKRWKLEEEEQAQSVKKMLCCYSNQHISVNNWYLLTKQLQQQQKQQLLFKSRRAILRQNSAIKRSLCDWSFWSNFRCTSTISAFTTMQAMEQQQQQQQQRRLQGDKIAKTPLAVNNNNKTKRKFNNNDNHNFHENVQSNNDHITTTTVAQSPTIVKTSSAAPWLIANNNIIVKTRRCPALLLLLYTLLLSHICHNHTRTVFAAATTITTTTTRQMGSSAELASRLLIQNQNRNNFIVNHNNHNNNNSNHADNDHKPHNKDVQVVAEQAEEEEAAFSTFQETYNHILKSYSIIDGNQALEAIESTRTVNIASEPIFDFGMPRNITARTGQSEAIIKCRVEALHDKSVSWIRKRDLHILSVGTATYTSDKRFEVTESKDQREWLLHVKAPQTRDSGIYECQINTEPKISMAFQLNIIEISPDAKAVINGPADLHFKVGSAIILSCIVQQPSVKDIGPIYWYRGETLITPFETEHETNINEQLDIMLPKTTSQAILTPMEDVKRLQEALNEITQDFTTRIAMESQLGDTLKSRLRISNAQTTDTGNYTCQPTTASSASVMVHVINDENPAAMQKSAAVALQHFQATLLCSCITTLAAMQLMLHAAGHTKTTSLGR